MRSPITNARIEINVITNGAILGTFEGTTVHSIERELHTVRTFEGKNKKEVRAKVEKFLSLEWVKALTEGMVTNTQMETSVYYY